MKFINERTQILEVYDAWMRQYPRERRGSEHDLIAGSLAAIDKKAATAAEVAAIIGNDSWTNVPACDECGETANAVVQLGQEPDYESRTAYICRACLIKALALTD